MLEILFLVAMALCCVLAGSLTTIVYYRLRITDLQLDCDEAMQEVAENGYMNLWEPGRTHGKHRANDKSRSTFSLAK